MDEESSITETFRQLLQRTMPNRIVTNFIAVAETTDGENCTLGVFVSDSITPWLANGMLQFAIDEVANSTETLSGEKDE